MINEPTLIINDENFGSIYIGNKNDAQNILFLKKNNIKAILNCSWELQNYTPISNIHYLKLMMADSPTENLRKYLLPAYKFIKKHKYKNILIHCTFGISRSVSILFGCLLLFGYDYDYVEKCIKKRKIANPNFGFKNQLKELSNLI